MDFRRTFRFNPTAAVAAVVVALGAGSAGTAAISAGAQAPAQCLTDETITGTPDDDRLKGTPGDDVIFGGGGDDVIRGRGGNDILCGRGGDDTIKGGNGEDLILGGGGDDVLRGGPGDDDLIGNAGFDTLFGGAAADLCDGESETDCEDPTPAPSASPTTTPSPTPSASPSGTATPTATPVPPTPTVNIRPAAGNDSYSTNEDQTRNVTAPGVLGNDTDTEGTPLQAVLQTGTTNGALTLNQNGSFTYVPNPNYNGTDSFTYKARDAVGDLSDVATVNLTVNPVADAPAAVAQATSTDEDTQKQVTLVGTDADGVPPSVFKITSLPSDGNLRDGAHTILVGELPYTLGGNTVTYAPDTDFFGLDDFDFRANDGGLESSAAQVSISVNAVNDAPSDVSLSNATVDEGKPAGETIGSLSATDVDPGDTHAFSLLSGMGDNDKLQIVNGVLKTDEPLDYGNTPMLSVWVRATDAGGLHRDEQFHVSVNDLNSSPVVDDATFSLPENSANATAVGTATGNDPDPGDTLTWSIASGNTGGAFTIDSATGAITVADTTDLDFETTPSFSLGVKATDDGSPAKSDTGVVTVDLTNVNEAPTDIALSNASVAENSATGTTVGNLTPVDPDAGDTHSFGLVSGAGDGDNGKFQIDNGVLKTAQAFDFETQGPFSIRIQTKDAGNLTYEEVFSVAVTNVNDAPDISAATFSLPENSANNSSVGTASATDQDSPAQTLTYSITGGNALGAFQINSSTGAITVADSGDLDFETTPSFALTVTVTDNGTPAKDDSATITVNLTDVNENPVVNAATLSLAENSANGATVGTVTASDPDTPSTPQTLTWAITNGNTGGAFAINSSTGAITVADTTDVDFETNPTFGLTVQATDNGTPNMTGSNTITVNLTNVNETPTDISVNDLSVAENASLNTVVGTISGSDPDAGDSAALVFSLASGTGDTDNARFNVGPSNSLRTSEVFDKESQGPFSIRLRATDGGSLTYEEVFSVTIDNVNESPDVIAGTFAIDENSANGTAVGTATATDPDAATTLTWAITGGNSLGAFAINANTGAITVADSPDVDFETTPSFALTVRATDNGTPQLNNSDTITVNLNDVNDNPVVNAAVFSLAENSANGTAVGTVTKSDQDSPAQTITWAITGGNASGAFAIDPSTGAVTVADTSDLDFETTPSFSLTVEATDNGTPNKTGSNSITVNLTNVNEKAVITAPNTISATALAPNTLTGISIADPDAGSQNVRLTIAADNGTVTVNTTATNGIEAAEVTGNGTDSVSITAPQTEINTTLASPLGLVYQSDPTFSGTSDTLNLGTDDLGNTGTGGAKTDAKAVTLQFNAPPVVNNQTVSTNEDTAKTITLTGSDADAGDTLRYKILTLPASGGKLYVGNDTTGTEITTVPHQLGVGATNVTFLPAANANGVGADAFTFNASDTKNDSNTGTITVDVSAVDDASVAVNDAFTVLEDSSATAMLVRNNDTDIDSPGPETIASVTQPTNGTVSIIVSNSRVQYTPVQNYCNNPPTTPVDSFTYTLTGGSVGTVNVTVTCVDDLPVAVNDSKTMDEDSTSAAATTINVLSNDTDQDGGPKTIAQKTNGTNGTVAITNSGADLTYTPNANYCGSDTFTYTLNGGSSGTVTVTVTCVDDAPVAVNDTKTVLEDAAATTIDVLGNDTDIDAGPKVVNLKSNSTNGGTVTITNSGADLTYAPAANYCNTPEVQPSGANPSETFTYTLNGGSIGTVTVTVTCVNDAPNADTETLDGGASALSNTRLDNGTNVAGLKVVAGTLHNVLQGDTDIEGHTISLVAGADCTGTAPFACQTDGYDPDGNGPQALERGTVSLETDGDFHYVPPAGFIGTDSFDYRISDGQAQNNLATGTVNINVVGPRVWYVDDSAGGTGNGTSASPLQGLAALSTGGSSDHLDGTGDHVFVYSGTYTNGITLENGQKLIGEPESLDVTDTLSRTHNNLVAAGGTAPAISHASSTVVTLGQNNELQDLALGNGTITLSGPTGIGTTGLVRDTSISNTGGKALDINGGTMDMVFSTLTSNSSPTEGIKLNNATGSLTANGGTLTNAGNAVVDINDASQTVTLWGNISDGSGPVISITNTDGGTKNFKGTVTGTSGGSGPRIDLTNNTGSTIWFENDLLFNNTAALPAFNATGGGTVLATSDDNILGTSTGTPLNVVNTTIGAGDLMFDSISSNGASNGIVLDNTGTQGNLNVTGTGPAASGGTIANTAGADAATTSCTKPSDQPAGVGILLKDTNGVVLNDVVVNGSSNFGLLAHDVNGFTMDDSSFTGTHGTNENQDEGSAYFCDLTGTVAVSDSTVGGGYESSFKVQNASGSLNLDVTNSTFATSTAAVADDAFATHGTNNAAMSVDVSGSTFPTSRGDLLQYALGNTGTGDLQLTNSTFSNNHPSIVSGGGGITVGAGGAGSNTTWTYNINNNDFRGARGSAITITTGTGGGTFTGVVSNNDIGVAGVAQSASTGAHGIGVTHQGTGVHKIQILNNRVRQYRDRGIDLSAVDGSPTLRATIQGNLITEPDASAFAGLRIAAGALLSDSVTICADVGSSTTPALENSLSNSHTPASGSVRDIAIRAGGGTATFNFPGYAGGPTDVAALTAYLQPRNDGDGTPAVFYNESLNPVATESFTGVGANCL